MPAYDDDTREAVLGMVAEGFTQKAAAHQYGLCPSTVKAWIAAAKIEGRTVLPPKRGQPRRRVVAIEVDDYGHVVQNRQPR